MGTYSFRSKCREEKFQNEPKANLKTIIMGNISSSTPKYIAHRAADTTMSENTLESMQRMHEKGAKGFEIDCYLMRDGNIAVIHDDELERTTTGKGRITKKRMGDLKDVFMKGTDDIERIPRLQEMMAYCHLNQLYLMIEVKGKNLAIVDLIDDLINAYDGNFFTIYSFRLRIVWAFARKNPKYQVRLNMKKLYLYTYHIAKRLGVGINLNGRYVRKSDIDKLKTLGPEIHVYTVNNEDRAKELINFGVTSVITDTLIGGEKSYG